jgi:PHP family Zn ribbon phosphoesterase
MFDSDEVEAVDIAIKELKQKEKKAQWKYVNKTVVCSNCQTWFNISDRLVFMRYCPYCGRKMKWGD